jgi:hypothetical protein
LETRTKRNNGYSYWIVNKDRNSETYFILPGMLIYAALSDSNVIELHGYEKIFFIYPSEDTVQPLSSADKAEWHDKAVHIWKHEAR